MWELWATIEANEVLAEDFEINDNLFALGITWRVSWCYPIVGKGAVGEGAYIKISRFSSISVEPETGSKFHEPKHIGAILGLMQARKKLGELARRHKVALSGVLIGIVILQVTQGLTGSGDYTFQPSSSAVGESKESVITLAGKRSAELILPKSYTSDISTPLLINLHGYSGNGPSQSSYTFLQEAAFNSGLAYIAPTGSEDSFGSTYWNATDACCDFNKSKVNDIKYLDSLIEKSIEAANIDSSRIYLFGHSNGHFMSYAYLCSGSTKIAAVAGLAGAMDPDLTSCKANPNNILHIHGEKDGTILYQGGALFGNAYTSAAETVAQWQLINKCTSKEGGSLDLLQSIEGSDTEISKFNCKNGSLEFWSLPLGIHTPALDIEFAQKVIDWLVQFKHATA